MKSLITLSFIFFSLCSYSQDFSSLGSIPLGNAQECANAEGKVLECANFIVNNPFDADDVKFNLAAQFVMKWMDATPDYTFDIGDEVVQATNSDKELLGVYLSFMAKYVLENKNKANDQDDVRLHALTYFLNYCENSRNKVEITDVLQKMIEAKNKGQLKDYLYANEDKA